MTRWSAITRTPPPLLRARPRLALHSRAGNNLNPVVHHEPGRYCVDGREAIPDRQRSGGAATRRARSRPGGAAVDPDGFDETRRAIGEARLGAVLSDSASALGANVIRRET
jgi:hypothetical protein